jgi:hypothetical protein
LRPCKGIETPYVILSKACSVAVYCHVRRWSRGGVTPPLQDSSVVSFPQNDITQGFAKVSILIMEEFPRWRPPSSTFSLKHPLLWATIPKYTNLRRNSNLMCVEHFCKMSNAVLRYCSGKACSAYCSGRVYSALKSSKLDHYNME